MSPNVTSLPTCDLSDRDMSSRVWGKEESETRRDSRCDTTARRRSEEVARTVSRERRTNIFRCFSFHVLVGVRRRDATRRTRATGSSSERKRR